MPYLADKPVGEDGYYMLTVAWNTAKGDFLAYNYGQETTGVQPLGTLLYAVIAWPVQQLGGDRWTFVRAILFFSSALFVLFSFLVGHISRLLIDNGPRAETAFLLGTTLSLFNFYLFRTFTYGLETGFYLIGIACCVLWMMQKETIPLKQSLIFGALVGVTGLVRIDFGIVFAVLLIVLLFQRRISLTGAFASGTTALALVSPWFGWVYYVTGDWLQSSGSAQSSVINASNAPGRLISMAEAVINHMTPWVYTGSWTSLTIAAAVSLGVAGLLLYLLRRTEPEVAYNETGVSTLKAWAVASSILIVVYPIFFWATHFYGRYTAPITVVLLPALGAVAAYWIHSKHLSWLRRIVIPGLALPFFVWTGASLHTGRIGNSHAVTAGFLETHVPSKYRIGAFQSGVIGYFHPNTINLDGKIDHRVASFLKSNSIGEYVDRRNIDVLTDWKGALNRFEGDYLENHWKPCGPKIPNGMSFCRIRESLPSLTHDQSGPTTGKKSSSRKNLGTR
jgi:hypothetical protein